MPKVDSDGDGLDDETEALIGTSPLLVDTDGDGFSDLLEYRLRNSGFNPLYPDDADCAQQTDRVRRIGVLMNFAATQTDGHPMWQPLFRDCASWDGQKTGISASKFAGTRAMRGSRAFMQRN